MRLFLSFVAFFLLSTPARAANIAGGDISYQYLGKNRYLIVVKLLRDCKGDSMDKPDFGVYNGNGGGNSCGSSSIYTFKRIRITDITTRCSTANKSCSPQNTKGTGRGIEEHVYVDTADFSKTPYSTYLKNSCAEITFYVSMPYRIATTTIATTSGFALTASINIANLKKCNLQTNNGPVWSNNGYNFICCNQANYSSYGSASNPDMDSIVYHLIPALAAVPSTQVTYISPFSAQYPLTPYCVPFTPTNIKCTPNLKTTPPRGFFMDTGTAITEFTPCKCDEISVISIQATEYRLDTSNKYVEIGRTRREITYFAKDSCPYNNSPVIKGPFVNKICEGEKICYSIYGTDETFSQPDTVKIYWIDSISGASFKVLNPKDREKEAQFCWQTKIGDGNDIDYAFDVVANDQSCPNSALSVKTFKIKVNKIFTSRPTINILSKTCGKVTATVNKSSVINTIYTWNATNINTGNAYGGSYNNDTFISVVLPQGKYKIRLFASQVNHCTFDTFSYVTIDSHTTVDHGSDTLMCNSNHVLIAPTILNGNPPYKYQWYIGGQLSTADTFLTLDLKGPRQTTAVKMVLTDKSGCQWPSMHGGNYTKTIDFKNAPNLALGKDTNLCPGDTLVLDAGTIANATYLWNTGSTKNKISVKNPGKYYVNISIPNGCPNSDTINVKILKIPVFSSVLNSGYCHSKANDSVGLNALVLEDGVSIKNRNPVYSLYSFNNNNKSPELTKKFIYGNYFLRSATAGIWTLKYNLNYYHCPVSDSIRFNIYPMPVADFETNPPVGHENGLFLTNNKSTIPDNSKMRFHWNFGRFAGDTTNSKEPLLNFSNNVANYNVLLVAISNRGCMDSVRKTIQVLAGVSKPLPAGFTMDDKLVISGKELKSVKLFLYNTNGQLVLKNSNNSGIQNINISTGIYFYKLKITKLNGEEIPFDGKMEFNTEP